MNLPAAFRLVKSVPINELKATLHTALHIETGATILHLENDDEENVFCLSFQTYPTNSNGVAHILEHTVLCGSEKFPVKDPFFGMTRRSLNTYMNALTGSDFTCYPAASLVEQDFYNLLEVYLDAVFHPKLKKMSFLQEGHRLAFKEPLNSQSELVYKGIVYNEMKGSLSSPEQRLWHSVTKNLLPDLPYAHDSGGDPKVIPELTYEGLIDFHKKHYHPSRCLFFFYGNLPLEKHLKFIEKHALKGVEKCAPLPPIPKQKPFNEPRRIEESYPSNEPDLSKKTFLAFSWLTASIQEQSELLALTLLESVLLDTDASPLKRALLASNLTTQVDSYIDPEMSEMPLLIVCRGSEKEHAEELEKLLFSTLREIAEKGIDEELITSSMHQLEFSRLEIQGDHGPFGLTLFFRSALIQQHGAAPESGLLMYTYLEELQEKVKNPHFLSALIEKHLLKNPTFLRLTLSPDLNLQKREEEEEKERLKQIKSKFSDAEKQSLIKENQKLHEFQEEQENQSLDCLPTIHLKDVNEKAKSYPLNIEEKGPLTLYHHDCFTNHILYAQLVFNLPDLTLDEIPYFSLLTHLVPELGSGQRNYLENLAFGQSYLGGFSLSGALNTQYNHPDQVRPSLAFKGKALYRNSSKLFKIMRETLQAPRFDEKDRIKELVLQLNTSLQSRLNRNPLSYALISSCVPLSRYGYVKDLSYGFSYYQFIANLAKHIDEKIESLIEKLIHIKQKIFHGSHPDLVISSCNEGLKIVRDENFFGLLSLPQKEYTPWKGAFSPHHLDSHARITSSSVAFTGSSLKTLTANHPQAPALTLATQILDNTVLHRRIREQGGAYGGGSQYNPMSGHFSFYSYRDPHITSTLKAFDEGIEQVAKGFFNENDLIDGKLQVIQSLDSPTSPGSRAISEYYALREGKTKALRQQFREDLLKISKEDLQTAVSEHLLKKKDEKITVTFSSEEHLKKEKWEKPKLSLLD